MHSITHDWTIFFKKINEYFLKNVSRVCVTVVKVGIFRMFATLRPKGSPLLIQSVSLCDVIFGVSLYFEQKHHALFKEVRHVYLVGTKGRGWPFSASS